MQVGAEIPAETEQRLWQQAAALVWLAVMPGAHVRKAALFHLGRRGDGRPYGSAAEC